MSELIAIAYTSRERAAEVLEMLRGMGDERPIAVEAVCTVTRDVDGTIQLHQVLDYVRPSAEESALWTSLASVLFLAPLVGLIMTVASGTTRGDLTVYGVDHAFIRGLRRTLPGGTSAVFALIAGSSAETARTQLQDFGGAVLRTALASDARLRLSTLLDASVQAETG